MSFFAFLVPTLFFVGYWFRTQRWTAYLLILKGTDKLIFKVLDTLI